MPIQIATIELVIFIGSPPGVDPSHDLRASDNPSTPAIYTLEPGTPPGSHLIATWYTPIDKLINLKGFAKIDPGLITAPNDPTDVDVQLALSADTSEVNNVTMRIRVYVLYDGNTPPINAPPVMQVSPNTLTFTATAGGANPPGQIITLTNTGGGVLTWAVSSPSQPWLIVAPATGSDDARASSILTFAVNIGIGMLAGTYTATVMIIPSAGSAVMVAVTLVISSIS